MKKLIPITRRNWYGLIMAMLFIILIPLHILYRMLEMSFKGDEHAAGLLGYSIIGVICLFSFELIWHTLVEMELTDETIVFRKPWKHYGFFRKSRNHWTLRNEEWNELYVFSRKTSYILYFRKDQTAVFFATIEEGKRMIRDIEQFFPDKKVFWNEKEFPRELRKQMKKEFPERVMRG